MIKNAAHMNFSLLTSSEAVAAAIAKNEFKNWVGICWAKSGKTRMEFEKSIVVMGD